MSTNSPALPLVEIWTVQPEADGLIQELIDKLVAQSDWLEQFRLRLLDETGIRLIDIIDHLEVPDTPALGRRLTETGFDLHQTEDALVATHSRGIFPSVLLTRDEPPRIAVKVESVAAFLAAQQLDRPIEGVPHAAYRKARVDEGGVEVWVVERHGFAGFAPPDIPPETLLRSVWHQERFQVRQRFFDDIDAGFDYTDSVIRAAIADLGADWTCALFLKAEREYWERSNRAGALQKKRQDALGLGWANDDHHTYDCSREWFHRTIQTLELLGFRCRERFYAGAEAGWGSQILEQPIVRTVVFADIDLAPDELTGDFAHARLEPLPELRRAGLWCALHGESMLEAGLNHLECTFDSARLHEQLEGLGVRMMQPFSNFPHLYQELTVGERWPVRPGRIERLLQLGQISEEQARDFATHGAIGSHFENLERNQGFKGFNQPGISQVLRIIDPRENLVGTP